LQGKSEEVCSKIRRVCLNAKYHPVQAELVEAFPSSLIRLPRRKGTLRQAQGERVWFGLSVRSTLLRGFVCKMSRAKPRRARRESGYHFDALHGHRAQCANSLTINRVCESLLKAEFLPRRPHWRSDSKVSQTQQLSFVSAVWPCGLALIKR
jgi:hypothetical protein